MVRLLPDPPSRTGGILTKRELDAALRVLSTLRQPQPATVVLSWDNAMQDILQGLGRARYVETLPAYGGRNPKPSAPFKPDVMKTTPLGLEYLESIQAAQSAPPTRHHATMSVNRISTPRPTRERFLILDDKRRMVGSKDYLDVTTAIMAADHQASWPTFRGRLVVRSNYDEDGVKIGDGQGRVAATREEGRWSGPDVTAGSGYLADKALEAAHERRYNLPRTTKTHAQLRREIKEVLSRPPRRR